MKILQQIDKNICEYAISDKGIVFPLLVDLPHGGRIYPDDFGFSCPRRTLELCEERYVDELITPPSLMIGGTALKANFPRTYVDLNRSMDDVDQLLFDTPWEKQITAKGRSVHGHGIVMRLIRADEPIYSRTLSHTEVQNRIETYYVPYHNVLGYLSDHILDKFGVVYHLNCHSMPSSIVANSFPQMQPDIIIGDLDGRSCNLDFRTYLVNGFKDMGYRVAVNHLYKGAEIINRYGQPAWNRNSLQIEINRALFQDEKTGQKNRNFSYFASDIEKLVISIKNYTPQKP